MSVDVDRRGKIVCAFTGCHSLRWDRAHNTPRLCGCWTSIWPARCYSQGLSSTETLCGPLVVTVLHAAWRGHVCHIPPCHSTRRRAVSWLSSCHTWMMLLSPQSLTVTCLGDNYHQNQLSYPPGSKGLWAGDWQAFNFASSTAVRLCHLFHCWIHFSLPLFY